MKDVVIKVPDSFTEAQISFIKRSAMSQVEGELKNALKIPQADIDSCDVEVSGLRTAMGIAGISDPIVEPK